MTGGRPVVACRQAALQDARAIARVHVRTWQSAYRGILPDSFLDALEPASREERWEDALTHQTAEGRFTHVAELSAAAGMPSEIIGFASGGPERDGLAAGGTTYEGEVYALYVAPEHQRAGTGRRLVKISAQRLVASGTESIVIWALKDNGPARAFYEGLGGVVVGEKTITIGPSNLLDVAYGWPDARVLLARAEDRAD